MFVSSWLCTLIIATVFSGYAVQCGGLRSETNQPPNDLVPRGGKGKGNKGKKGDKDELSSKEIAARLQSAPYPPYPAQPYPPPPYAPQPYPPYQYPQYPPQYQYPPPQYPYGPQYPPQQYPNAPYPPPVQQPPPQGQQPVHPVQQPPPQPQPAQPEKSPLSAIIKGSVTTNIKQHNTFAPTFGNIGDLSLGKFLFGDSPDPDLYDEERPMQDPRVIQSFLVGKIEAMKDAVASLMGGDGEDHPEVKDAKEGLAGNQPILGREFSGPIKSPEVLRNPRIPPQQYGKYSSHKYFPSYINRDSKRGLWRYKGHKHRYPHRHHRHSKHPHVNIIYGDSPTSTKSHKSHKPAKDSGSSSSSDSGSFEGWN